MACMHHKEEKSCFSFSLPVREKSFGNVSQAILIIKFSSMKSILSQVSHDHRSYERNSSNWIEKPKKVRTSTRFEPVTSRYRCDAPLEGFKPHWNPDFFRLLFAFITAMIIAYLISNPQFNIWNISYIPLLILLGWRQVWAQRNGPKLPFGWLVCAICPNWYILPCRWNMQYYSMLFLVLIAATIIGDS